MATHSSVPVFEAALRAAKCHSATRQKPSGCSTCVCPAIADQRLQVRLLHLWDHFSTQANHGRCIRPFLSIVIFQDASSIITELWRQLGSGYCSYVPSNPSGLRPNIVLTATVSDFICAAAKYPADAGINLLMLCSNFYGYFKMHTEVDVACTCWVNCNAAILAACVLPSSLKSDNLEPDEWQTLGVAWLSSSCCCN